MLLEFHFWVFIWKKNPSNLKRYIHLGTLKDFRKWKQSKYLSIDEWLKKMWYMCVCIVAQRLKHLPPMRETRARSLGQEDPLEKDMVTHSSILAWRIPWMEEPGRLWSTGLQRVGHD